MRKHRRKDRQSRGPEDAEQQQSFAAELLRHHAARDLRRHVAVKERGQNDALPALVPDELAVLYTEQPPIKSINE